MFEPVPDESAALADLGSDCALVIADYHAGLEVALRREGVELPTRDTDRREALLALLDRTDADHIIFLGDIATDIGASNREERSELQSLFAALTERVPVTIVKGNHDGAIEELTEDDEIRVTGTEGIRIGSIGFVHGHTWPSIDVLTADTVVMGHEHPMVRLIDEVGGSRTERVWLRGPLRSDPFEAYHETALEISGELVVCPAFNDLTGGTWTNLDQDFLSPFLPAGVESAQAYLLNGTRLGAYDEI